MHERLRVFVDCGGDFRRTVSGLLGQRRSTQEPAGLQRETEREKERKQLDHKVLFIAE